VDAVWRSSDGKRGNLACIAPIATGRQQQMMQVIILLVALPLQLALIPMNARTSWLTPGELRFWSVAIFILVEIVYLAVT